MHFLRQFIGHRARQLLAPETSSYVHVLLGSGLRCRSGTGLPSLVTTLERQEAPSRSEEYGRTTGLARGRPGQQHSDFGFQERAAQRPFGSEQRCRLAAVKKRTFDARGLRYSGVMSDPIRILQVTDPHLHAHRDAMMRGLNTYETFMAIVERVATGARKPHAVIATGDLVQDETRQGYERFRDTIRVLDAPVHCIPGNHDSPRIMAETLSKPPFHFCGTHSYGNWQLVMLNTAVRWEDAGRLETTQLRILESALKQHADRHVLVAMHHHPVPVGSAWLDGLGLRNGDEFLDIIDRYDNVRGVAWGHVHQAFEQERNGIRLFSTPSTCSQFLPDSDVFMMDSRPPAYRWIELHTDGTIDTEIVWLS